MMQALHKHGAYISPAALALCSGYDSRNVSSYASSILNHLSSETESEVIDALRELQTLGFAARSDKFEQVQIFLAALFSEYGVLKTLADVISRANASGVESVLLEEALWTGDWSRFGFTFFPSITNHLQLRQFSHRKRRGWPGSP